MKPSPTVKPRTESGTIKWFLFCKVKPRTESGTIKWSLFCKVKPRTESGTIKWSLFFNLSLWLQSHHGYKLLNICNYLTSPGVSPRGLLGVCARPQNSFGCAFCKNCISCGFRGQI